MKSFQKKIYLFIWILLFMPALIIPAVSIAEETQSAVPESPKPERYLVATYFHNTFRCPTCHAIEDQSAEAIKNNFATELKNGTLVWRVINVDEPVNQHYVKDYQLYTKHLIISEMKDGKEIRWKDLKEVWTYVHNEQKFEQYVKSEIEAWLKG